MTKSATPIHLLAGGPGSRQKGNSLLKQVLASTGIPSPSIAYVGAASDDNREFFNLYYSKPWIRCDVYILGLLAACFYLEYKQNKEFCLKLKTWLANSYIVHLLCYVFGLLILNLIFQI